MENTFEITDLYIAAYLYCKADGFQGLIPQGNAYLFVFKNHKRCSKLATEYLQGKSKVDAKKYSEAIKTLKGLVFSEAKKANFKIQKNI